MRIRSLPAAFALVFVLAGTASAEGIDASVLAPGLVHARDAIARLERLTAEAEAIGTALFRVHNEFGERRIGDKAAATCETEWLVDLGARAREFGRAFRDAVQSVRMQGSRVEALIVEPTVRPLLDPETNHRVLSLLARVDDLVQRYPEAASWHARYVEPLVGGCSLELAPRPGLARPVPEAVEVVETLQASAPRRPVLVAVLAFGGGWLCPGAVPAAGVMLVTGKICYSDSEACTCEPAEVSPATVLGPETKAGSAN
jgi:hypothetical protein